jgi:1-phosphofructokinase family hexose kinase
VIIAAGLSPAWQQILVFDKLTRGAVNRAVETHGCASGKVINVGIALTYLQADSLMVSVCGGSTGELIFEELRSLEVPNRCFAEQTATRTCTTLIERPTGEITELVENARPISAEALRWFQKVLLESCGSEDWLVFSGSLPAVTGRDSSKSIYREIMESLEEAGASPRVILDARGPELVECLPLRPFLVKPNREELAMTVGRPLSDEPSLIAAMREINQRGAEWVLVTHGPDEVWLSSATELWKFVPPRVDVVNAIGCGDCLTAGLVAALDRGLSLPEAVKYGIAAAGENAKQLLPSRLDPRRVEELAQQVRVERPA